MLLTDSYLSGNRNFPVEIVSEISRWLSPKDLDACSKTNKFLQRATLRPRAWRRWIRWPPASSEGPSTEGKSGQFTIKGTEFSTYPPYTDIPAVYRTSKGLMISIGTPIELASLQVKSIVFRMKAFDPPWDDDFANLSASQQEERLDALMTQWTGSFSRSQAEHLITDFPGGTPDTASFEMYSAILHASCAMERLTRLSINCGPFVADFFLGHVVRMDLEPQEPFPNVTRVDIILSKSNDNSMYETYSLLQNATFPGIYVDRNTWLSARGLEGGVKIFDPDRTTLKLYPSEDTEGPALRIPPGFKDFKDLSTSEVSEWRSKPKVILCFQPFDLDSETEGSRGGIGEPYRELGESDGGTEGPGDETEPPESVVGESASSGTEGPESETEAQENEATDLSLETRKYMILVRDSDFDDEDFEEYGNSLVTAE